MALLKLNGACMHILDVCEKMEFKRLKERKANEHNMGQCDQRVHYQVNKLKTSNQQSVVV